MARPATKQNEFIRRCKLEHGDRYGYEKVVYVHAHKKIKIKCLKHGYFLQIAHQHMRGFGCPDCGGTVKLTTAGFIKKAKDVHGDKYGYLKSNYTGAHRKVKIKCPDHGYFQQAAGEHLRGAGCYYCGIIINQASNQKYARKQYRLGNRVVGLQGYEPIALDYIQQRLGVKAKDLRVNKDVPVFTYFDDVRDKDRLYFPDALVVSQNRIVEVKSDHTFKVGLRELKLKRKAVLEQGYKFSVLVFNSHKERVKVNKKWYREKQYG